MVYVSDDFVPVWDDDDPTGWMKYGACIGVDTDIFFPERGQSAEPARQICWGCMVRQECIHYATFVKYQRYGIWGATSERERRKLRKAKGLGVPNDEVVDMWEW